VIRPPADGPAPEGGTACGASAKVPPAARSRCGGGRPSGPPLTGAPARTAATSLVRPAPRPYAGDQRLTRALAGLKADEPLTTIGLAGEWQVSRRTTARILRAARDQLQQ
jgi:hypothetical protein